MTIDDSIWEDIEEFLDLEKNPIDPADLEDVKKQLEEAQNFYDQAFKKLIPQ